MSRHILLAVQYYLYHALKVFENELYKYVQILRNSTPLMFINNGAVYIASASTVIYE